MTEHELLTRLATARGEAHRAPFAEYSMDKTGHTRIVNHTDAFKLRSNEFVELVMEANRRGLELPKCDCPDGAHDWEVSVKRPRSSAETERPGPNGEAAGSNPAGVTNEVQS